MTKRTRPTELPTLFPATPLEDPAQVLQEVLADSLWLDAVTQASLAAGRPIPEAKQDFERRLREAADEADQAVLVAAVARCHNSQMRLLDGARLLGQAWRLLGSVDDDRRVFVQLEMGRYLLLVGQLDAAHLLLADLPQQAEGEYLRRLAAYYLLAIRTSRGDGAAAAELRPSMDWFRRRGHASTAVAHLRMLASLERAAGRGDEARRQLSDAIEWCPGPELAFCRALLRNDTAASLQAEGRLEEALAELELSQAEARFPYARIDALDLCGRFLLEAGRLDEAAATLTEALTLAREAGTLIILPSLAYHLGLCHERRGDGPLARHFHAQGYEGAMLLLEHGLPPTPTRLQAIRAHVDAQRRWPDGPAALPAAPGEAEYAFALGRSLKDIRTLFQTALLDEATRRWGSQKETVRRLGLANRTAVNVRQRHRDLGGPETPSDLVRFVDLDLNRDWKQINRDFDDRVLLWLADRHRGRLRELSERLEVGYTYLSNRIGDARRRRAVPQKESKA